MNRHPDLPSDIPLHTVDLGGRELAFPVGTDFWTQVQEVTDAGDFATALDQALEDHPVPRVWLLLHERGQEALSTAAGLGFAKILSWREQAVLVLDCDDWACSLTQWAGRQYCEGWIDMVRTGNSVLTAGHVLPFAGGRKGHLIGVGSFTPTDVTAQEMEALLGRLRRQADDILLVAPADGLGMMWASFANIRLLCWDQGAGESDNLPQLVSSFAAGGTPLSGLVGLGLPRETTAPVDLEPETSPPDESPVLDEEIAPATEVKYIGGDSAGRPRKTSGVFWGAAAVFVALITVAFIYYWQFVRVPESQDSPPAVAVTSDALPTAGSDEQDQAPADQPLETGQVEDEGPGTDTVAAVAESLTSAEEEVVQAPDSTVQAEEPVVAQESTEQPADVPADPPAETIAQEEAFDMAPYLVPVASEGWALHVYSFADSAQARQQLNDLSEMGFQVGQNTVQIPDKGRYYRILLGSFPTREAARRAKGPLLAELGEDWAQIVEF